MSLFHPGKAQRHKEGVSVLKSEDYKTLVLLLLGEVTFVIRPDGFLVNLGGACNPSVLQYEV
jgi:hypothetical protein